MPIRVAINGFGRIGRTFFKQAIEKKDLEIVALNDLTDVENLAYLLRHDSVYGNYEKKVEVKEGKLTVDRNEFKTLAEKDPEKLPWKDLNIDVVVESTGFFTSNEKASAHLKAGAKRVVISAPAKGEVEHTLIGANEDRLSSKDLPKITSDASCTTNAAVPIASIMGGNPGIVKASLNTIHGYTASQGLVDGPNKKDYLRGRAAAVNIVPSHTGAADATAKSLPALKGIFDGIAIRVPVVSGSLVDFTFLAKRKTSVDEINNIFREAAKMDRWQGIFAITEEPLVSTDILKNPHASTVDLTFTRVIDGDLVKVLSWYDNEWGYTATLVEHVIKVGKLL